METSVLKPVESKGKDSSTSSAADLPAVPVNQSPVEKFKEFLELRKLKCTEERLKVVEHVFEKHNHFEADQLVAELRQKNLRVSRSTVYRILPLLVEAGLLRTLQFGLSTAYEHDYGYPHHEHLFCERCGLVIEFVSDELSELQDQICRKFRFRPTSHRFVIQGLCEKCAAPGGGNRRLDMI